MTDFTASYSLLFYSLVFLCLGYGLFLVFYVNDKIRDIDIASNKKSRQANESDQKRINENAKNAKKRLERNCRYIMIAFLAITLVFNTLVIIFKGYDDLYGFIGGFGFPIIAYLVFIFFLMVAMGLKGAILLRTGRFFKGLNY
jgi:hypothetical protein